MNIYFGITFNKNSETKQLNLLSSIIIEQILMALSRVNSSFLSGDVEFVNSVNTLLGGRFYLNSDDKKTRFYVNLLVGLNYNEEEKNNMPSEDKFQLGFAGGAFVDINRIIIGLSYDTPKNLILKLGYSF